MLHAPLRHELQLSLTRAADRHVQCSRKNGARHPVAHDSGKIFISLVAVHVIIVITDNLNKHLSATGNHHAKLDYTGTAKISKRDEYKMNILFMVLSSILVGYCVNNDCRKTLASTNTSVAIKNTLCG